jgi:lipid II:glycine glycyltransferase (peptidoglycan interpeptide bridge formation enzyme)
MVNRDEYVQKLKSQIDKWNAEMARWEGQAKKAQVGLQAEYAKQLEQLRQRREEALAQLRKVQNASLDAWTEFMRGTEEAWKRMGEAFDKARSRFDKK